MAQGADASEKFLSLVAVLPGALQSFWPSLHPLDLLVGLCCGGSLRLAVYLKSKNAKKYRHGLEYGSARWGTREDKCTGKAPEPPAETSEPEKEKPAGLNPAAIVLLLALLGGGGVFAYLKFVKNKPKTKGNDSLDDYDYGEEDSEEWETEDEESDEPDADGGSTEEDDEDSVK